MEITKDNVFPAVLIVSFSLQIEFDLFWLIIVPEEEVYFSVTFPLIGLNCQREEFLCFGFKQSLFFARGKYLWRLWFPYRHHTFQIL